MGRHAHGWKLEWRGKPGREIGYVRFSHAKRQHLISTGKRDPREASEEAARLYARVVAGGDARPASTRALIAAPLASLWAEWLASLVGTLDPETLETYETTYVGKHWPDHYDTIRDMCDRTARERYRSARLRLATSGTVKKETWVQDKFLRWCAERGVIPAAPPRLVWDKRTTGTRTGTQRATAQELTREQVAKFLAALPEWFETGKRAWKKKPHPIRARFVFMYETSLRPATLSELVWSDWLGDRLRIRDTADKVRFGRDVPLTAVAKSALESVREGARARGLPTGDGDLVFGAHLYRKTIARAARAAGLKGVAPYDLRHGRATHLADAGASLTGIGHILGHKQATTTSRYLHGSMRAAIDALSRSQAVPTQDVSEKVGWPSGFEPPTPGATKQQSDNSSADLATSGTDRDRQEPPWYPPELGIVPRIFDDETELETGPFWALPLRSCVIGFLGALDAARGAS